MHELELNKRIVVLSFLLSYDEMKEANNGLYKPE